MSKKLLQTAMAMAMANLTAYGDMFDGIYTHFSQT